MNETSEVVPLAFSMGCAIILVVKCGGKAVGDVDILNWSELEDIQE